MTDIGNISKKIDILIVDDSLVARELLSHIFLSWNDQEFNINIAGTAGSGQEALEMLRILKPDIITMDLYMPGMSGFDAARRIMEEYPAPIVIVTSLPDIRSSRNSFKLIEAGALAIVEKPPGPGHSDYDLKSGQLRAAVKAMSGVKVVRRWQNFRGKSAVDSADEAVSPILSSGSSEQIVQIVSPDKKRVVVIGASTGGPLVLQTILSSLPSSFPLPVMVVQHIAQGFLGGMVNWLSDSSALPIHIPYHCQDILPGNIYVAPDNYHMGITTLGKVRLSRDNPECGSRPSVSYLFREANRYYGKNTIALLLTGMGNDGVEELIKLREADAETIAQNEASCVIYGMPGNAIKSGAAKYVLSPEMIVKKLLELAFNGNQQAGSF